MVPPDQMRSVGDWYYCKDLVLFIKFFYFFLFYLEFLKGDQIICCLIQKSLKSPHSSEDGLYGNFFYYLTGHVLYSILLHLPPLGFHCLGDVGIDPWTISTLAWAVTCSITTQLDLIHYLLAPFYVNCQKLLKPSSV